MPSDETIRAGVAYLRDHDRIMFERALGILHRMGLERTGWRSFFSRWYYPDEPLRNDAANLVRECRFSMMRPINTRLVGETDNEHG